MVGPLLDDQALANSPVVANNAMNRDRGLDGVNSYARELGLRPLEVLAERVATNGSATWLDLCCGSARALIDAAERTGDEVAITGVDLVDFFDPRATTTPGLDLVVAPLATWAPAGTFDLITSVHGLHYVGDKLGVLGNALTWLAPGGLFAANLDLASIWMVDGSSPARKLRQRFRAGDIDYDPKRRLITCRGPRTLRWPFTFVGADDAAGPNYTRQPAVNSHYRAADSLRP